MSVPKHYRTRDEWFAIIQECRRSGLTDAEWCNLNDINRESFRNAIKKLRKASYAVPDHAPLKVHDLTASKHDVVQVNVVPEFHTQSELVPVQGKQHLDNSHTIEITMGNACVRLSNDADQSLLTCVLQVLGGAL